MRVDIEMRNEEMSIWSFFRLCILIWGYQKWFNIAGVAEISTISHCIQALGDGEKLHLKLPLEY